MLSRRSHSRLLPAVIFGLLIVYADPLWAQFGGQQFPAIHAGPLVSVKSGAEGHSIEVYAHQPFTLELDKPIRSISGYDPALLVPTPSEPKRIQFLAQSQHGETTLLIKDEDDTLTKVAVKIKSRTIEKLQKTLKELFPDVTLELVELNNAILIRGKIGSQLDLIRINEVAGQYYPEVLNHSVLHVKPGSTGIIPIPPVSAAPPIARVDPRTGLPIPRQEDKTDLHSDIRALHADVKRLIELLEQRQSSTDRKGVPQAGEDQARRKRHEYVAPPARVVDPDDRPDAAHTKARRGTFSGVIRVAGEVPDVPPAAKADHPRNFTDEPIPDDSLIVGDNNGLANVFVYLREPPPGTEADDPAGHDPVKLTSRKGRLVPHCAIVRVGQEVQLQNLDPVLTDFHTFPVRNSAINMAVAPNNHSGGTFAYKRPEPLPIKIGDDIHPWKRAYHLVVDHPYAAVTDKEGRFQIEGLPPGEYEFQFWHERGGYIGKDFHVTIGEKKSADAEIRIDIATLLGQRQPSTSTAQQTSAEVRATSSETKPAKAGATTRAPAKLPRGGSIVYFYADWAAASRELISLVERVGKEESVPTAIIDVQGQRSAAKHYGVTAVPTLMIVHNQKEVDRIIDLSSKDVIRQFVRRVNQPVYDHVWNAIGLRLEPVSASFGNKLHQQGEYRVGMLVTDVSDEFAHAGRSGLQQGDILVGLGISGTKNIQSVIQAFGEVSRTDASGTSWIKFHAIRNGEPLQGELRIATTQESNEPSAENADDKLGWADVVDVPVELLYFQADWCVPCQQMGAVIRGIKMEGPVRVRTVDVDKDRALAEKYGITSIPTMLLLRNGKEVNRRTGTVTADDMREFLRPVSNGAFTFHVGFTR